MTFSVKSSREKHIFALTCAVTIAAYIGVGGTSHARGAQKTGIDGLDGIMQSDINQLSRSGPIEATDIPIGPSELRELGVELYYRPHDQYGMHCKAYGLIKPSILFSHLQELEDHGIVTQGYSFEDAEFHQFSIFESLSIQSSVTLIQSVFDRDDPPKYCGLSYLAEVSSGPVRKYQTIITMYLTKDTFDRVNWEKVTPEALLELPIGFNEDPITTNQISLEQQDYLKRSDPVYTYKQMSH